MAKVWTEVIYDTGTRKVHAAQQFDHDRKDDHDWGLLENQAFIRLDGSLPIDGINGKRLSSDLTSFEVDPTYVPPAERIAQRKADEIAQIESADTIPKLHALLIQKIEDKYSKKLKG